MESTIFEERFYLFEELQTFGASGNNTVFSAYDSLNDRNVFIKIYPPNALHLSIKLNKLEIYSFHHHNLVELLDFFYLNPAPDSAYKDSLPVLVMNYVSGYSLSDIPFPISVQKAEVIYIQILSAINYLHIKGFVHRDIKPDNVLVENIDSHLNITLCDIEQADYINAIPESLLGTPEYMSPSVAKGECLQPAHDFWSLGCLLYQLLTGELPFGKRDFSVSALDGIQMIQKRIQETNLKELINKVPNQFQPILIRYWNTD